MELLSPAGSRECLIAAVRNGADAVYFGGGSFNARRYANNFDGDELIRAVDFCHERDVKCYITLNTLLFDRELSSALSFAAELYHMGADAVLVQDLGLASILRRELPNLTLHASTQMGIHDLGGIEYCKSIGITRAVLAREVSLEQIKLLAQTGGIELEVFAHGALCMGFSGSCLYSSMSGERSGNRGTCAQPCRKRAVVSKPSGFERPYSQGLNAQRTDAHGSDTAFTSSRYADTRLPSGRDFCLSPNDICMIEHLHELNSAGVSCIKIEGRMKKPEYVACVTRAYRAALDGADVKEIARLKNEMFRFFNRGEFNTAHYFTDSVRTDRIASSKPDAEASAAAKRSMADEYRLKPISMRLELKVDKPAELKAGFNNEIPRCDGSHQPTCGICAVGNTDVVRVTGAVVKMANRPQSAELYRDRLGKLGDTPFRLENCVIDMSPDCYISSAELNELRRVAVQGLLERLHVRNEIPKYSLERDADIISNTIGTAQNGSFPHGMNQAMNHCVIYARAANVHQAELAFENGANYVAIDATDTVRDGLNALQKYRSREKKLILALPNVLIDEAQLRFVTSLAETKLIDGIETNNIGQTVIRREGLLLIGGIGLNALNGFCVRELLRLGCDYIMPSPELTFAQLRDLAKLHGDKLLIGVHGRTPLMQLLHCPVKEHGGCMNCTGNARSIIDEAGREFPLANLKLAGRCVVRMLNCRTTDLIDILGEIPPAAGLVLSFIGENDALALDRLNSLQTAMTGGSLTKLAESTRGHWNRKVD